MLLHLLGAVERLGVERKIVVVGAGRDQVESAVGGHGIDIVVQDHQLGTGHAVMQAHDALSGFAGDVLILYGDVPLVSVETMRAMIERLNRGDEPRAVVVAFRPPNPGAYGRIVANAQGMIEKMVEYKDASSKERSITLCNSGIMAVRSSDLFILLDRIGNENAAGEYYLPDIVMLPGSASAVIEVDSDEVIGVNNRTELSAVEAIWQAHRRLEAMRDGATLIAPDTVYFSHDTRLGRDVVVEPHVIFGTGVTVENDVVIHGFSHIDGAVVREGAEIGPFARLRPGADIGRNAKIGNFVEIKKATLSDGAKVNHLSYIGDADIGARANIGAGTITCNYDGFFKYRTIIGDDAFIGSNSALVAPVTVGNGAIIGAGSVVTQDVAADALALARGKLEEKPGWAKRFRAIMKARKVKD